MHQKKVGWVCGDAAATPHTHPTLQLLFFAFLRRLRVFALRLINRALRAAQRVAEFLHVLEADGKGDCHFLAKKFALHFGFQCEVAAVAGNQCRRHGAGVTQGAPPGDGVPGRRGKEAALFDILAAMIVAMKIATRDWLVHWQ